MGKDWIIRKVYKREKDGRWIAYCRDENNKPRIISYPKILMEKKLCRELKPWEDVHHKDENIDNNDISNLEVREHGEHQREHSLKYNSTEEVCMVCGSKFIMDRTSWHVFFSSNPRRKRVYITCSKSCAGKAGSGKYKMLYNIEDRLKNTNYLH